jgi:tRNA-specific 2-thiouridylase
MTTMKNQKIIVGMSGGVDSSVSALLLKQQGYEVEGLFMKNWEEEDNENKCSADQDLLDAQAVCLKLGIRFHTINFATEYWDRVFTYFLQEYKAGRTPNPDIMCNKEIKFNAFLNYAFELGADYIATGHYARHLITDDQSFLLKGLDPNKDQSYFLHALNQRQLKNVLFPVGELPKTEVRKIAEQHGLRNYAKKDSTGICFIGERKFKNFLQQYLPAQPGNIETPEKKVLGQHQGLMFHTIGQRQGLGIGGIKDSAESAWYVLEKDLKRNVLIVGQGNNHPLLFKSSLMVEQLTWISDHPPILPLHCRAKIRYRQEDQACVLRENGEVNFEFPQRAVTPGQSIVFYEGDICLGGGIIQ